MGWDIFLEAEITELADGLDLKKERKGSQG